jgi:hypothetical protein
MVYHLNYPASRLVPLNLPVFHCGLFPVNRGLSSNPEDTCSLDILHREMVEKNGSLAVHLIRVKRIFHQEEDVDIFGVYFGCDEGPKHDEARDLSGSGSQLINVLQALAHEVSWETSCPEMVEHFTKGPLMNPDRQIAILIELRPLVHANYLSCLFSLGKSNAPAHRERPTRGLSRSVLHATGPRCGGARG